VVARVRAEITVAAEAASEVKGVGGDGKMEQGEGRRVGDAGKPGDAVGAAEAVEEVGDIFGVCRRQDGVLGRGGLRSACTKL